MTCSFDGCDRPVHARGLCEKHYRRLLHNGSAAITRKPHRASGSAHPQWRGDQVGHMAVHVRLRQSLGKASGYTCACGKQAHEWSYDGGDPNEKRDPTHGSPYSVDPAYYTPRCRNCHRKFDARRGQNHGQAKLTDADVAAIRAAVAAGDFQRVVAERFGVSQTHISRLVRMESRPPEGG